METLTLQKLIAALAMWLIASTAFAQFEYAQDKLPNQGQAIGIGAVKVVADLEARIVELESRDIIAQIEAISTDEFAPNDDNLLSHFAEEHQGARLLKKLHEYIHQQIEKLRPNGAKSFIVIEATTEEYAAFMRGYGAEASKAGWLIQRRDKRPGQKVASIVAIGKTHFIHVGFLTRDVLQKFVDKATPRSQGKPLPKKLGWASVRKIVLHTYKSGKQCDWCIKTENETLPQAKADGVDVSIVPDLADHETAPQIEVCTDNSCRRLVGYYAWSTIKQLR